MAKSRTSVMLVSSFILLILLLNVNNLEALRYRGLMSVPARIDSSSLLQKLGYDLAKIRHVKRAASPSRISPGGPDPEHHSHQPKAVMP
ncbi:hypothetical protein Tsubulata_011870 [Turnera subulata]|uniref:Uncharacterized protein n=1 Tax=Turnera subulata TaxID=218843 RepID=A0A9Q0GBM6_9ROSI|nr:hypothetical protein Tsubulata_011870 [Turnera subulata]